MAGRERIVTVRLSEFAREALSGEDGQSGGPVPRQVVRAIRCYLNDKGSAGPGWSYPRFLRERTPAGEVELDLKIEDALWRSLEEEAQSQGVTVRQMLEHAVLYFAAEVNAGRLTERILDDLDDA